MQLTWTPEAATQPVDDDHFHADGDASQGVLVDERGAYSHPELEEQLVANNQLL